MLKAVTVNFFLRVFVNISASAHNNERVPLELMNQSENQTKPKKLVLLDGLGHCTVEHSSWLFSDALASLALMIVFLTH